MNFGCVCVVYTVGGPSFFLTRVRVLSRLYQMEEQRLQSHAISAEDAAHKRVQKVRVEMESQLKGFVEQQKKVLLQAAVVEAHSDEVDKVGNRAMILGEGGGWGWGADRCFFFAA